LSCIIIYSFIVASFSFVIPLIFAGSCTTIQVSTDVQSGRSALKLGQPKEALTYFEAAAAQDPNYSTRFTLLTTGIWTYVGKAYYEIGEKEKALASLKRAKESSSDDYVASIYLGLVMSQNGRRREGIAELEAGLKGLGDWLETTRYSTQEGQYWDPSNLIADSISKTRKMVQAERPDWQGITANVEWLGKALEEEIEEVQNDERNDKAEAGDNE